MKRASGDHPVAMELRREVGFRCPIPGCGKPILTYHHFDPPWREQEHNEAVGMIALCKGCHDKADGRYWTDEQLRGFKKMRLAHPKTREELISVEPGIRPLYRLGGTYMLGKHTIEVDGVPLFWEDHAEDGTLLFSFNLYDHQGARLLEVRQNSLGIEDLQFWDFQLNTRGNHLIVRPIGKDIALDLHLRRVTSEDVRKMVNEDSRRLRRLRSDDSEAVCEPEEHRREERSWFDEGGAEIIRSKCMASDGRITLINFQTAMFRFNGVRINVKHYIHMPESDSRSYGGSFFGCE